MSKGFNLTIRLLPLFVSLFLLGYYRSFFFSTIAALFDSLVAPGTSTTAKFPTRLFDVVSGIASNYLWIGSALYAACFAVHAALAVWIIYQSRRLALYSLALYGLLTILCFLFILLGNMVNSFSIGYGLARHIRSLMESPFFLILLIPAMRLFKAQAQP
jgi:hypothetical protein